MTAEAAELAAEVEKDWLAACFGPGELDLSVVRAGVDWLYAREKRQPPRRVVLADGPTEMRAIVRYLRKQRLFRRPVGWLAVERMWDRLVDRLWHLEGPASVAGTRLLDVGRRMRVAVSNRLEASHGALDPDGYVLPVHQVGLSMNADLGAAADFVSRVRPRSAGRFEPFLRLLRHGCWDGVFERDVALVCRPPVEIHVDARDRLHSTDGPAIRFSDGTREYRIEGLSVPREVVEERDRFPASLVLEERNAELRRIFLAQMGNLRFVKDAGARVVCEDVDGAGMPRRLLQVPFQHGESWQFVAVKCPSTGHDFILRVPPRVRTCADAIAWTFGLQTAEYAPQVET